MQQNNIFTKPNIPYRLSEHTRPGPMFMGQIRWPNMTKEIWKWAKSNKEIQYEITMGWDLNKIRMKRTKNYKGIVFFSNAQIFAKHTRKEFSLQANFQAAYSASGPMLHLIWMSILLSSFFLILSTFLERYSVVFRF